MAEREQKAHDLHHQGLNCAQTVLAYFADKTDLPYERLLALGSTFGSGIGNMKGTCGALTGAEMVLGLVRYEGKKLPGESRELHEAFIKKCGSSVCGEIKGVGTGKVLCSCDDCILRAIELLEERITI